MLRLVAILITILSAIAGAVLFASAALAQSPDPTLPVAGPDEIIFVGEVPAPPGTEVTVSYLTTVGIEVCGVTRTDDNSRFVVAIDATCPGSEIGPAFCWGPDSEDCRSFYADFTADPDMRPIAGDTFDVGLLVRTERNLESISMPSVGGGNSRDNQDQLSWLHWSSAALLLAGVVSGGASMLLRRKT